MSDLRTLSTGEFPPLLNEIPDKPASLYIRGSLPPQNHKLLAVVGSRRMSRYGKDACEHLIQGLRGYSISIVSGLALGIDATAHQAALDADLHTIAVPGSGIDNASLYPRSNTHLAQKILEQGGALLSEETPGTRAAPYLFPKRNRVMAGMSHAVLVIEAGEKSGTLITAKLATEYNRDLLTVPHSIFSDSGAGGHIFMKIGAAPTRTSRDILAVLGIDEEKKNEDRKPLSPLEQKVINTLSSPLPRDELIRTLGIKTAEANALLLKMELEGLIQETLGEIRKTI